MIYKNRLIVLTGINNKKNVWAEHDDIQSLVRLLLYSCDISIEGIIAVTSCYLRDGARDKNLQVIYDVIDAYGKCLDNLKVHRDDYPSTEYLKSVSCCGIDRFGMRYKRGFASLKYVDNAGVKLIIDALDKKDDRPIYFAIWGGINTLAQAIWQLHEQRSQQEFDKLLAKIRIYAIADQDAAGLWLRKEYGDKLFYIVSPTSHTTFIDYYRCTWPGISADNDSKGFNNGKRNNQIDFHAVDSTNISPSWIKKNIQDVSPLGKIYPDTCYLMEGDTPSYLSLIPNGLNMPGHPEAGSWGGRYVKRLPNKDEFTTKEIYPIYTNAEDTILGIDGKAYKSAQASIYRWREDFQNDFACRMSWTSSNRYDECSHPPIIKDQIRVIKAKEGRIELSVEATTKDKTPLSYDWFIYKEAGSYEGEISIEDEHFFTCKIDIPKESGGKIISLICKVQDDLSNSANKTRFNSISYARIFIEVE